MPDQRRLTPRKRKGHSLSEAWVYFYLFTHYTSTLYINSGLAHTQLLARQLSCFVFGLCTWHPPPRFRDFWLAWLPLDQCRRISFRFGQMSRLWQLNAHPAGPACLSPPMPGSLLPFPVAGLVLFFCLRFRTAALASSDVLMKVAEIDFSRGRRQLTPPLRSRQNARRSRNSTRRHLVINLELSSLLLIRASCLCLFLKCGGSGQESNLQVAYHQKPSKSHWTEH